MPTSAPVPVDGRISSESIREPAHGPRPRASSEPIAIVGMGCRFPGGITDPRTFWNVVANGTDAIIDIPPDRWQADAFHDPDPDTPGRTITRRGGFLTAPVDTFDAGFFGMAPREAAALDPQQRLLLEVTWEAFEDAGIPPGATAGTRVGAYVGGFTFDALTLQLSDANRHLVNSFTSTGASMTMLSARLAYTFDWRGPCLTIDTACSSSLVALHHACTALARGECDLAVAGGVNVMVNPSTAVLMSKGRFLSPDGRSKPFDHRANGYGRGEGAGIVVLKPLAAAERDGDRVHAVVRGTAVNQDGHTPGIAVPRGAAQRTVIREACRAGGVEPGSVGYFEAHGTGTAVGDPIEATAIGEVLAGSEQQHWIGSVKSNIGHTEAAAGVAGVIKAALCLQHRQIPPNLHFERPNPDIPFERLPVRVPTRMVPFPQWDGPRRAGVNSFGFGGTNAHVVLEEAGPVEKAADTSVTDTGTPCLLVLSARSPEALRVTGDAYATLLGQPGAPALPRLARTAARRREHHPLRAFVVADDAPAAVAGLRELELPSGRATPGGVAFVYTGMGPQWWGMGRELLLGEPRFDDTVAACDEVLARWGISIAEELLRDEAGSRLTTTLFAQVANFVVQAGLTAVWRGWGIEPMAIVGHSVGEVAASYAAGALGLEDALTVSYHRASLQARLAGRGAMAAVDRPAGAVRPHLVDGVGIAAVNSPTSTTLSGDPDALDVVTERLGAAGASVKRLRVEVAYHSHQMEEVRAPLLAALAGIRPTETAVPLWSTVTGDRVHGPELGAEYWWRNVREPVSFGAALQGLLQLRPRAVLEVGPHPVLAAAIDEALTDPGREVVRLASLRRDRPRRRQLLEGLGALYVAGIEPDWSSVHPGPPEHLDLPRYPWQRERHWVESTTSRQARLGTGDPPLAGRPVVAPAPTRDIDLSPARFPYLADHRIDGTVVFPGSGYLDAALSMFPGESPCFLEDVVFHRPLTLRPGATTTLRVGYEAAGRLVRLHGRDSGDDAAWELHAQLRRADLVPSADPEPWTASLADLTRSLPEFGHDEVYDQLDRTGLDYGPAFRAVRRLWLHRDAREILAEIDTTTVDAHAHPLHPVLLDAALHATLAGGFLLAQGAPVGTYVPARIEQVRFFRPPGKGLWIRARDRHSPVAGRFECDLTLLTDGGQVVAEIIGLRAQALADGSGEPPSRPTSLYYEHAWVPQPREGEPERRADGGWVVVVPSRAPQALVRELEGRGGTVQVVATEHESWPDLLAPAVRDPSCRGVVCIAEPAAPHAPVCAPITTPLRLAQDLPTGVPLFLITAGAQSVSEDDVTTDPFAASVWGFARVLNAERPDLRCRVIDLEGGTGGDAGGDGAAAALVGELADDGLEDVALRRRGRFVRRLARADERSRLHHLTVRAGSTPVRLLARGTEVEGLGFVATTRREPGPTEVEIEVAYAGLNFKDVLKATGLLSPEVMEETLSGESLGMECSGTVVRAGAAVTELRPGDAVFAHARDLFATHATLDAVRVVRVPQGLSLAQAASLFPVATAHLSLARLAGVRAGERVLVHSAAGGVGLAAVRIASRLGAQVYATAGTEDRREFLRREGVAGVSDSTSTVFADDVRRWTGGAGIDVVLSSLPGEVLHKSLGLLGPFGRFVELGKADIAADRSLSLAPFRRALSFHALDYDQLMLLEPERVREVMQEVAELFRDGSLEPLPVTEVPAAQLGSAFRLMMRRGHIGKVVVRMQGEPVTVPAASLRDPLLRPDATYLITGGLGGLGLAVARWLADRGARHLVLVGRRGIASPEAARAVEDLRARGVEARVERLDVGDRARVREVLGSVRATLPPLRGVVHGAADFDDDVLPEVDAARLLRASRPKADGAWNLHLETAADDLDLFVLFSSVAAQLGTAGTAAYTAANEFLHGLARYRRGRGLPATSLGWGMVNDVGAATGRGGAVGQVLHRNGHLGMPPTRLVAELETCLRAGTVEASIAGMDWPRWAQANAQLAGLPRYGPVVPAEALDATAEVSVARRLRLATPAERAGMLPGLVGPLLERITGLSGDQLDGGQAIDMDSLAAVELRVLLQNTLGVSVPGVKLQRNLTVPGLVGLLAEELELAAAATFRPREDLTVHEIASADGLTVFGHVSMPPGPGPHPAVVVCTAGTGGALDENGEYARVSEHAPLHAAGFAVLTVDPRGAPGHGADFGGHVEMGGRDIDDIVAAADYLSRLPGVDPGRLSILGTSRGAYCALLALARDPALWHRAVLIMGLFDPLAAQRARPGTLLLPRDEIDRGELEEYFSAPERQSVQALGKVSAPLLLVHGDADEVIPLAGSRELAGRARELGLPVDLITVPGMGHDNDHADDVWGELWPSIGRFLRAAPPHAPGRRGSPRPS